MLNKQSSLADYPPGYRVLIGASDPEGIQYGHRFGGPFLGAPDCLTCGRMMHLLFLFDLNDPRLHFITLPGIMQLPLVSCLSCSTVYERQYFALRQGGTVVEAVNPQVGEVIGDLLPRQLKPHALGLRPLRAEEYPLSETTWLALIGDPEPKHQIGGNPLWLQQPEIVACPGCGQPMVFVAMFNDDPDIETGVEPPGVYLADSALLYLFYCSACVMLGTAFQSL